MYALDPVRLPPAAKNVVYFVRVSNKATANTEIGLDVMTSPDGGPGAVHSTILTTNTFGATPTVLYASTDADTDGQLGEYVGLMINIAGGGTEWATVEVYEQVRPC